MKHNHLMQLYDRRPAYRSGQECRADRRHLCAPERLCHFSSRMLARQADVLDQMGGAVPQALEFATIAVA
jgi:hypothetical protein